MLFHSYSFVLLFLPLCVLGFYGIRKQKNPLWPRLFLIAASFFFYGFSEPVNIPVLLVSLCVNYGLYTAMEKSRQKKPILICGLILNLGMLFAFKYTGSAFVPLGISFFTFSQIAFLMDCYRGEAGEKVTVTEYVFYVSFFPKILQGPIMLPSEMKGQLSAAIERPFDWERFYRSLALFILGLSKKVLLADTLGGAVDYGYTSLVPGAALHTGDAWLLILSYTLQLYFDFSGYCDMAMGTAGMLGFSLPANFKCPYRAANILEFWKGWHITLTRFFTRYLYIPLGGNRKGQGRMYLNILLVFAVSGIWHGAGVTFLIWGMLHGVLYVLTRWHQNRHKPAPRLISVAGTFLYVNLAWVFFRAGTAGEAVTVLKKAFSFDFSRINWELAGYFNRDEFWYVIKVLGLDGWQYSHYILMILFLLAALALVFCGKTAQTMAEKIKPSVPAVLLLSVLLVWCVTAFSEVSTFLYVNF